MLFFRVGFFKGHAAAQGYRQCYKPWRKHATKIFGWRGRSGRHDCHRCPEDGGVVLPPKWHFSALLDRQRPSRACRAGCRELADSFIIQRLIFSLLVQNTKKTPPVSAGRRIARPPASPARPHRPPASPRPHRSRRVYRWPRWAGGGRAPRWSRKRSIPAPGRSLTDR